MGKSLEEYPSFEIDGIEEQTGTYKTHEIFKWNPKTDAIHGTVCLQKDYRRDGDSEDKINYELQKEEQH